MSETWQAGVILITIVFFIIAIPCFCLAYLGKMMLQKLAYFPSKNPAIQMSIFLWLIIVEVASIVMLLVFYQIFVGEEPKTGALYYERMDTYSSISGFDGRCDRRDYILSA